MVAPRVFKVSTTTHEQQTPAPLFATRRGQLPNLPSQLAKQAIPDGETLLLQLPLGDWYTLNANANQKTVDVLPKLTTLPILGPPSATTFTAQSNAILFLVTRSAGSRHSLVDKPGKSLAVLVESPSFKASVTTDAVANLHATLRTDFVISPTDGPFLPINAKNCSGAARRRPARSVQQVLAFSAALEQSNCQRSSLIGSIHGGLDSQARVECVHSVLKAEPSGVSIDGLFAGESPDERDRTVQVVMSTIEKAEFKGLVLLSGACGAPWEVLAAVRCGIDIIDATFPFDMAECGYATSLSVCPNAERQESQSHNLTCVNLRDRCWEQCKEAVVLGCNCFVCRDYSKAYVRHLLEVREMMGVTLLAAHNLWDYLCWFQKLRQAIAEGSFDQFVTEFVRGQPISANCAANSE